LLKTLGARKNEPKTNRNEPKNEAGHVVENKWEAKNGLENPAKNSCSFLASFFEFGAMRNGNLAGFRPPFAPGPRPFETIRCIQQG
jgi:hypothetical protein